MASSAALVWFEGGSSLLTQKGLQVLQTCFSKSVDDVDDGEDYDDGDGDSACLGCPCFYVFVDAQCFVELDDKCVVPKIWVGEDDDQDAECDNLGNGVKDSNFVGPLFLECFVNGQRDFECNDEHDEQPV